MEVIYTKDTLIFFWRNTHGVIFTDISESPRNWYSIDTKLGEYGYDHGLFSKFINEGLIIPNKLYKLTVRDELDRDYRDLRLNEIL